MQRRIAIALSLAFTTIVTFGIIVVGTQGGFFGARKSSQRAAASAPAASVTQSAPPPQDPLVVTSYMYVDQTAVPVGVRVPRPASPNPASPEAGTPPQSKPADQNTPPAPQPSPRPAPTRAAEPTPPPPTAAPVTSTPKPATTPAAQPSEMEFIGSVSAISGDLVTFTHGGTATTIKVTSQLSSLQIGTTAHVHAVLSGGAYVATEIELGG